MPEQQRRLVEAHPEVAEMDCNPLLALPDGAVAEEELDQAVQGEVRGEHEHPEKRDGDDDGDDVVDAHAALRSGAAEGRIPNATMRAAVENWIMVLREDQARG